MGLRLFADAIRAVFDVVMIRSDRRLFGGGNIYPAVWAYGFAAWLGPVLLLVRVSSPACCPGWMWAVSDMRV
jgi:hypothetical protein